MTVDELIKTLQKMPGDKTVRIYAYDLAERYIWAYDIEVSERDGYVEIEAWNT